MATRPSMGNWGDEMSGSIKVKLNVEVEVVGPAHSPAHAALDAVNRFGAKGRDGGPWKNTHAEADIDVDYSEVDTSMISDEAAERRVELGPLLGGGPSKHRQTIDADDQVTSTRCQFWRRCSLVQFLVAFGICFAVVFLCIFPSSWDPFLRVFMATLHYWLLIGLMMGLLWCCIRSRAARRPVVVNAPCQELRASSSSQIRILSLNMCLLPAGINFSGKCLCDGDDRKAERLGKLVNLIDDFDIVLLNELWGSPWSGHHGKFTSEAVGKGFNVVTDPIGAISNTGNMILSRFPLRDASSIIFKSHAGWQSMVPNGVLHATCQLPTGEPLHLFTTHLQCTTAPPDEILPPSSPIISSAAFNHGLLDLLEKGENVSGGKCDTVRKKQLEELKAFMHSVVPTMEDKYLLGGDLNVEGGSPEYAEMTRLFGRQSLCAPDFLPTYNTDSFLTPPGWRDVEYSVCLDHMISNLDVQEFTVLQDDISDHRGLSVLVSAPQPAEIRWRDATSSLEATDAVDMNAHNVDMMSAQGAANAEKFSCVAAGSMPPSQCSHLWQAAIAQAKEGGDVNGSASAALGAEHMREPALLEERQALELFHTHTPPTTPTDAPHDRQALLPPQPEYIQPLHTQRPKVTVSIP